MRTLEELKLIDDGGSFDRLVKKVEEAVDDDGDESLKLELLTEAVLRGFIRKATELKLLAAKAKESNCGVKLVRIPRKIRIKGRSPDVSRNNESIMKKPAVKKQGKADSLDKKRHADSCLEEEEEEKKKRRKGTTIKKNNVDDQLGVNPPPELPQEFKTRIERLNGTDVMLVIQKELTSTDMDSHQGRFAVPKGQLITHDFLSEEEINMLNHKDGIQCSLIQPCLEEMRNLEIKRWNMNKTFLYTLIKNWKSVACNTRNHLEVGSKVQLWSFRVGSQLWFALVKLEWKEDRETLSTGVTSI